MTKDSFTLIEPHVQTSPVIFSCPHSGREYKGSWVKSSVLNKKLLRSSEDAFVDYFFCDVPTHGAVFLKANAPRSFIDLNRAETELDSSLIRGLKPANRGPRVACGLGVIPRVVAKGRHIYRGKISLKEARSRIAEYWTPYHDTLNGLMSMTRERFGLAILMDCHSMPHSALQKSSSAMVRNADIVLGDVFGMATNGDVLEQVEAVFRRAGLRVVRNIPFSGAYITRTYGKPAKGFNCVQIEINRSLYMNEEKVVPNADFDEFRKTIASAARQLSQIGAELELVAAE